MDPAKPIPVNCPQSDQDELFPGIRFHALSAMTYMSASNLKDLNARIKVQTRSSPTVPSDSHKVMYSLTNQHERTLCAQDMACHEGRFQPNSSVSTKTGDISPLNKRINPIKLPGIHHANPGLAMDGQHHSMILTRCKSIHSNRRKKPRVPRVQLTNQEIMKEIEDIESQFVWSNHDQEVSPTNQQNRISDVSILLPNTLTRKPIKPVPFPAIRQTCNAPDTPIRYLLDPPVIYMSRINPTKSIRFVNQLKTSLRFHWLPVPTHMEELVHVQPFGSENTRWCRTLHTFQEMKARIDLHLPIPSKLSGELYILFKVDKQEIKWPIVIDTKECNLKVHTCAIQFQPSHGSQVIKIENLGPEPTRVFLRTAGDPYEFLSIPELSTELKPNTIGEISIDMNQDAVLNHLNLIHTPVSCYVTVYTADHDILATIPVSMNGFSKPIVWEGVGSAFEFDPCPIPRKLQKQFKLINPNPFRVRFDLSLSADKGTKIVVNPIYGYIPAQGATEVQVRISATKETSIENKPAKLNATITVVVQDTNPPIPLQITGQFFNPVLNVSPSKIRLHDQILLGNTHTVLVKLTNPLPVVQIVAMDLYPNITFLPFQGEIFMSPGQQIQGHLQFTACKLGHVAQSIQFRGLVPNGGPTTLAKILLSGHVWQPITRISDHQCLEIPATSHGSINSVNGQIDWYCLSNASSSHNHLCTPKPERAEWVIWNENTDTFISSLLSQDKVCLSSVTPLTETSRIQTLNDSISCSLIPLSDINTNLLAIYVVRTEGPINDILTKLSLDPSQDLTKFLYVFPTQGELSANKPSASFSVMFMPPKPTIKMTDVLAQQVQDPIIIKNMKKQSTIDSSTSINQRVTDKSGSGTVSTPIGSGNRQTGSPGRNNAAEKKLRQKIRPISPVETVPFKAAGTMLIAKIVYCIPIMVFLTQRNPKIDTDEQPNWTLQHVEVTCQISTPAFSILQSQIELGDVPAGSINTSKFQIMNHHPTESLCPTVTMQDPFRLSKPIPDIPPLSIGDIIVALESNMLLGPVTRRITVRGNGSQSIVTLTGNVYAPDLIWSFDTPTMGRVVEQNSGNGLIQYIWELGTVYIGEQHTFTVNIANNSEFNVPVRNSASKSVEPVTLTWSSDSVPKKGSSTISIQCEPKPGILIGISQTVNNQILCQGVVREVRVNFTPYTHSMNLIGLEFRTPDTIVIPLTWTFAHSLGYGITRQAVWTLQWPHGLHAANFRPIALQTRNEPKSKTTKDNSAAATGLGSITYGKFVPSPNTKLDPAFVDNLIALTPTGPTVSVPSGETVNIDLAFQTSGDISVVTTKTNNTCSIDYLKLRPLVDAAQIGTVFVSMPWDAEVPDLDGTMMEIGLAGGYEPETPGTASGNGEKQGRLIRIVLQNIVNTDLEQRRKAEIIDWVDVLDEWDVTHPATEENNVKSNE